MVLEEESKLQKLSRSERLFLVFLLGAFLFKGMAFALIVPPWQGPDEPANFAAIEKVIPGDQFGTKDRNGFPSEIKAHVNGSNFRKLRAMPGDFDTRDEREFHVDGTVSLYYVALVPSFVAGSAGGVQGALLAARFTTVLFGAGTVLLTFLLGRELRFGSPSLPAFGATVVAFVPQFGFVSSVVNKDALAALFGTAVLWLAARVYEEKSNSGRLIALAALLLAGLFVKPSLVALLPAILIGFAVSMVGRGRVRNVVLFFAGALIAGSVGLWVAVDLGLASPFGDLARVGGQAGAIFSNLIDPDVWLYLLPQTWGHFGWVNAPMNSNLYIVLIALTVLSMLGLAIFLGRRRRELLADQPSLANLAGLVASLVATSVVVMFGQVAFTASQGRFFFPAIASFALLFALGLGSLHPAISKPPAVVTVLTVGALLNVWVLLVLLPARFGVL